MSGPTPGRGLLSLIPLALLACGDGSSSDKGPPPAAPSNLAATVTSGRIGLSWTDNATDEFGFLVERSPDGATWTELITTTADTTVFTDIGLTPDTTYHYRVRAVGQGGYSGAATLQVATAKMAWETGPASPTSPVPLTARQGHSAIYDSLNQRMVVFGGEDGTFLNQVWVLPLTSANLAGATWTLLGTTGTTPPGRYQHSAVYDSARNRMVVFGGWDGAPTNEIWILTLPDTAGSDTPSWSKMDLPFGPSERVLHSAIYDVANDRMVVFGGSSGSAYSSEVWALRFTGTGAPSWAALGNATIASAPLELNEHAAVYDAVGQRMIVHGGRSSGGENESVYEASLPASSAPVWSVLTSATPPEARSAPTAVYDATNRRLVVFGGYASGIALFDDVWALSLATTPAWAQITPTETAPAGRAFSCAVYDPLWERLVLFSGYDPEISFDFVDNLAWSLKF